MERNTLLVLKGWLGVGRGGGGEGDGGRNKRELLLFPRFFLYLLYCLVLFICFCFHNVSLPVWHYESRVLFSAGIYFFFRAYPIQVSHS